MSELAITGKIKTILSVESGTSKAGKTWKKQNYIVANNEGYQGNEQVFCFEVFGDEAVENLTKFNKEGDEVKVSFNIKCNEWNGKYFTSLSSWRIDKVTEETPSVAQPVSEDIQDLPF